MNKELEALLLVYEAALEPSPDEAQRRHLFESRVEEALISRPGLDRDTLLKLIRRQHRQWLRAQKNPSSMPPKA
jgi:hypothetical protein